MRRQGGKSDAGIRHLIVDRNSEGVRRFAERALASFQRRVTVRAQHQDEVCAAGVPFLDAERGLDQIIQHFVLGSYDE